MSLMQQQKTPCFLETLQDTMDQLDDISTYIPEHTYLTLANNLQKLYTASSKSTNITTNSIASSNNTTTTNITNTRELDSRFVQLQMMWDGMTDGETAVYTIDFNHNNEYTASIHLEFIRLWRETKSVWQELTTQEKMYYRVRIHRSNRSPPVRKILLLGLY